MSGMYTYTMISKRVRAYKIRSVSGFDVITERGDTITADVNTGVAGDYIIVETGVDLGAGVTKGVNTLMTKAAFEAAYKAG